MTPQYAKTTSLISKCPPSKIQISQNSSKLELKSQQKYKDTRNEKRIGDNCHKIPIRTKTEIEA